MRGGRYERSLPYSCRADSLSVSGWPGGVKSPHESPMGRLCRDAGQPSSAGRRWKVGASRYQSRRERIVLRAPKTRSAPPARAIVETGLLGLAGLKTDGALMAWKTRPVARTYGSDGEARKTKAEAK